MKKFIITGQVTKVEARTSKGGVPYSIVRIEDKDGVVDVITGSKVEAPAENSIVLCEGNVRSNEKEYQGGKFYSYSFSASRFEVISVTENIEKIEDIGDQQIPF